MALNRATVYGQVSRWLIHDLRNPSQALTLVGELLHEEREPGDEAPEHTIRKATRHLARSLQLLDRMLRLSAGPGETGPVSLRGVLEFLEALHRVRQTPVGFDITSFFGPRLPAVGGVEEHLEHALLNILMNALEACDDRRDGAITVTASAATDRVVLDFADNGRGVAVEVSERLFQPFVTTKTERPLAGLGLFVARDLLARSGGTLEFQPRQSGGSRFIVTLQAWG